MFFLKKNSKINDYYNFELFMLYKTYKDKLCPSDWTLNEAPCQG